MARGAFHTAVLQALLILALASAAGLAAGWLRGSLHYEPSVRVRQVTAAPAAPPVAPSSQVGELAVAEARRLIAAGAVVVDARRPEDFALGHLPGAVNLPVEEFDACFAEVEHRLARGLPLLVYCGGGDCTLSHELADILRQMGFGRVEVLAGGLEAWKAAGLEVER